MPDLAASRRAALALLLTTGAALCTAHWPARARQASGSLRALTFNVWGLPTAPDRRERMRHIAQALAEGIYDVVSLQEAWLPADVRLLTAAAARGGLAYTHRYPSGLLLLSRYPIREAAFVPYDLNGDPLIVDHYVRKGVGLATLDAPTGSLGVAITHALAQHAPGDAEDPYLAHRQAQMAQLGLLANEHFAGKPTLVLGDLNVRPDQLSYRALLALAGLHDAYSALHPGDPGYTYDEANAYNVDRRTRRLDYALVRGGGGVMLRPAAGGLVLAGPPTPGLPAYSDHYGVAVEFAVEPGDDAASAGSSAPELAELLSALRDGRAAAQQRAQRQVTRAAGGAAAAVALAFGRQQWKRRPGKASALLAAGSGVTAAYAGFEGWAAGTNGMRAVQAFDRLIGQVAQVAGR